MELLLEDVEILLSKEKENKISDTWYNFIKYLFLNMNLYNLWLFLFLVYSAVHPIKYYY